MVTLGAALAEQLTAIIQTIEGGRPSRALEELRHLRNSVRDHTPASEWKLPEPMNLTATGPLAPAREYGAVGVTLARHFGLDDRSAIKAAKLLNLSDQCLAAAAALKRAEQRMDAAVRERSDAGAELGAGQNAVMDAYQRLREAAVDTPEPDTQAPVSS